MTNITKHAIRRYAERVLGRNLSVVDDAEAVHGLPETGEIIEIIRNIVDRGAKVGAPVVRFGGHRYVIKNDAVITVTPRGKVKRCRSGRPHLESDQEVS